MPRIKITENELLNELLAAVKEIPRSRPENALTRKELREKTGFSMVRITANLLKLREAGQLEVVQVYLEAINGELRPSPAYRILSKTK